MKSACVFIVRVFIIVMTVGLISDNLYSQNKTSSATKIEREITIDGVLNEDVWSKAESASGFIGFYPVFSATPEQSTEVKILYDNHSIYFAAIMRDETPDSIYTEFTVRDDDNGNVDYFKVSINPNNDGQSTYDFIVSAANVQTDIRASSDDEDENWDAVWYSAVTVNEEGWIAEIEIPYSAIRFPKEQEQVWAVNFFRTVRRSREISSWNSVDQSKGSGSSQMGTITNINDIDAPLRLALMPYVSGYVNSYEGNLGNSFSGGLDLKLGLSETYTLDMTLIPDFGQTTTDDLVLNLTPHETYYSENRPFFTEGTELFNKCDLFYSRRIGRQPENYYDVQDAAESGEYTIKNNPSSANLVNAFKISGRGKNNLAVGIFNAVTANTWAKVTKPNGTEDRVLTDPAANYSILVLDQSIGKNSYVNLTNANVLKNGERYISNITATSLKIMEKSNRFGISLLAAYSMQSENSNYLADGWRLNTSFGKKIGTWVYYAGTGLITDKYNPNDLGYLTQFNEINSYALVGYRKFSQFWKLNETRNTLSLNYKTLFENAAFTGVDVELFNYATTVKHLTIWNNLTIPLTDVNDYYEPRTAGRFYKRSGLISENFFASSDYRKKLALDVRFGLYGDFEERRGVWASISPVTRFGKKLSLRYRFSGDFDLGAAGYAGIDSDDIVFGRRDVISFTNYLSANYVFSNKISMSLRARHYVSTVDYDEFYNLQLDGSLQSRDSYADAVDYAFNTFNVDLLFSWNFLPGSYLSIMWKNQIFSGGDLPVANEIPGYYESFKNVWVEPQANSISLKLIYYLDYNSLVN